MARSAGVCSVEVLSDGDHSPRLTINRFGRGRSVYLSGFRFTPDNTRLLHRAIFWAANQEDRWGAWQTDNVRTEATWFPKAGKLVVINNAGTDEKVTVTFGDHTTTRKLELAAHGIAILDG